jgi:YD repeat-containing protein
MAKFKGNRGGLLDLVVLLSRVDNVKFTDPARNVTDYKYDNLDRLMEETTPSGTRKYAYAATGNLTLLVDRNEGAIRRQYDRLDRPTLEWWYASESDARANNSSYSDLTSYFYDKLGRPDEEQYLHRVQVGGVWQNDYRVTESRLYDGLDRITERSNQSRHNACHSADAFGPLGCFRSGVAFGYSSSHSSAPAAQRNYPTRTLIASGTAFGVRSMPMPMVTRTVATS